MSPRDYLGGLTRSELENLLLQLIDQRHEGSKVDFKSAINLNDKGDLAKIAKDIAAIANTDDDVHHGDIGYIILGATRGKLVGGVTDLDQDLDKLNASFGQKVGEYLSPAPQVFVDAFQHDVVGTWGVIIIPPSVRQPHVFIRDTAEGVKHEWPVRVGSNTAPAGAPDYARFLAKAVARAVSPLQNELTRMAMLVEMKQTLDPSALIAALREGPSDAMAVPTPETRDSVPTFLRQQLVRGPAAIEDALVAEALSVLKVMTETSETNPWILPRTDPSKLSAILTHLEEAALPLAEALAVVARYDKANAHAGAVTRALHVIARKPMPSGTFESSVRDLRLYPLVLCLYAVTIIAVNERRDSLLKSVLELEYEDEQYELSLPLLDSILELRHVEPVFRAASGDNRIESGVARVRDVLMPRLATVLAGTSPADAFHSTEFVLSLASMGSRGKRVIPGTYAYEFAGRRAIKRFLRQGPEWLSRVLGRPLEEALVAFDSNIDAALDHRVMGLGFRGGAVEAYANAMASRGT